MSNDEQQQQQQQQNERQQQQQQQHQVEQQHHHVGIVAANSYPKIPLPAMEDGNVESYFMSLDFWFAASGVSDDNRKYNTVMAQVPTKKLMELRSVIDALPNLNRYAYIKRCLIEHFADSQQRRLQRVLSDMPLGDWKPSKLFHEMSRTANGTLSEAVLLDLWATRLPSHAQAAVAASQGTAAERMRIADAVTESMSMRTTSNVDLVAASAGSAGPSCATSNLWPGLDAIRNEVAVMFREFTDRSRQTDRSNNRSGNRNRSQSRKRRDSIDEFEHCWYHRRFGSKAQSCLKPCSYKKPSSSTSSQ